MQCLTPPLSEVIHTVVKFGDCIDIQYCYFSQLNFSLIFLTLQVPIDQWLCPNCDNLLSDVDFLFSGITDMDLPISSRSALIRERRNVRSSRMNSADEPSTSSGNSGRRLTSDDIPTTSRGSHSAQGSSSRTTTSRRKSAAHTNRRRPKRRRTKTVIIEYEVQENGKFPVTKRVKRKLKKRRVSIFHSECSLKWN